MADDLKIRDIDHLKSVFAGLALHPAVGEFMNATDKLLHERKPAIAIVSMILLIAYSSEYVAPNLTEENILDMMSIAFEFHRAAQAGTRGSDMAKRDVAVAAEIDAILKGGRRG